MFLHTERIEPCQGYRLRVEFNNGVSGEIDLSGELWGEMFAPLQDKVLFASAWQDTDLKTVSWANGADMAPEYLYDLLLAQTNDPVGAAVSRDKQAAHPAPSRPTANPTKPF